MRAKQDRRESGDPAQLLGAERLEEMQHVGRGHAHHAHSAEIEAADRVMASAALAEEFEMGTSELLYHLGLVHKDNGVPVELDERHVNL